MIELFAGAVSAVVILVAIAFWATRNDAIELDPDLFSYDERVDQVRLFAERSGVKIHVRGDLNETSKEAS